MQVPLSGRGQTNPAVAVAAAHLLSLRVCRAAEDP